MNGRLWTVQGGIYFRRSGPLALRDHAGPPAREAELFMRRPGDAGDWEDVV